MNNKKMCPRCGEKKSRDDFNKDSSCSDGLCTYCKECNKSKVRHWREKKRAKSADPPAMTPKQAQLIKKEIYRLTLELHAIRPQVMHQPLDLVEAYRALQDIAKQEGAE